MARKKKQEEHVNHERWLVSYADFITLLFAFFVVMYSISSVNEGKYRVLSDTLESAFQRSGKSDQPIQIGELSRTLNPFNEGVQSPASKESEKKSILTPVKVIDGQKNDPGPGEIGQVSKMLDAIQDELKNSLATLVDQNLVTLRKGKDGLEVELKSKLLFPKASARLSISAEKLLIRIASTLSRFPTSMQVEGHTDSSPINSALYPSNWELSSARAATVVSLFAEHDMDPERMWAIGYAQYRPYSTIDTSLEVSQNRRVVLVIKPAVSYQPSRLGTKAEDIPLLKVPTSNVVTTKEKITPIQLPAIAPIVGAGQ